MLGSLRDHEIYRLETVRGLLESHGLEQADVRPSVDPGDGTALDGAVFAGRLGPVCVYGEHSPERSVVEYSRSSSCAVRAS